MEENKITTKELLIELHKRRQGYLFGGSDKSWCASPESGPSGEPVGKGCSKYASCKLIPEEIKWKKTEELTTEDIQVLQEKHCYRASYHINNFNQARPDILWDPQYISSREVESWIGNPLGIRNSIAATISAKLIINKTLKHRDTRPCPNGGCVVPEMETAYFLKNEASSWNEVKACPFYFRAIDEKFQDFDKNITRFAQCYITSEEIIQFLRSNRYISSASLFRESEKPDLFWYPFYSGYSFVQPLCLPGVDNDPGWEIITPSLRWHATSAKRLSKSNKKPNVNIFTFCENMAPVNAGKFPRRVLDVCDGYASFALLTWILANRIRNSGGANYIDGNIDWEYKDGYELYIKLQEIGFEYQLTTGLKLRPAGNEGKVFRKSRLREDLELLGLTKDGKETIKYEYLLKWIRQGDHEVDLASGFLDYSYGSTHSIKEEAEKNRSLSIREFIIHLAKLVEARLKEEKPGKKHGSTENETWEFDKLSALSPPLHIIVRAFLVQPLRWLFIPSNTELGENGRAKITSGTILLLNDSDKSQAYDRNIPDSDNEILSAVINIYPLISAIGGIEEQNRRDMMEQERQQALQEKEKFAVQAAISQVMARNMSHNIGSHVMNRLTDAGYLKKITRKNKKESYLPAFQLEKTDYSVYGQMAIYNNYVRSRMDYLSDISFSTPLMQTSRMVYSDVFRELDKVHLLLKNISGLGENFCFRIQLEVKKSSGEIDKLSDMNDFQLAFSNDVLGMQAFYNIIEAVIRNTAKHAENKQKLTVITLRFSELDENKLTAGCEELKEEAKKLICVEIFDNAELSFDPAGKINVKKIMKGEDDLLDNHFALFSRDVHEKDEYGVPFADWLVFRQNRRLNEPILNESNQLRATALGLIEMDASAAYLRRLDTSTINSNEYEINYDNSYCSSKAKFHTLKAVKIENDKKVYLGYRFFIPKPEEVLIVTRKNMTETGNTGKLKNKGIWIITEKDFRQYIHDKHGVFNHKFILHCSLDEVEVQHKGRQVKILDCYASSLTQRIIKISGTFLNELTSLADDKIIGICWTYWRKNFLPSGKGVEISGTVNSRIPFSVVYLNHLYSNSGKKSVAFWKDNFSAYHLEALSSAAQQRLPGFHLCGPDAAINPSTLLKTYLEETVNTDETVKSRVYESVFTKVILIDERIQGCLEQDFMGIKYKDLFPKMHVFIPGKSIDLSSEYGSGELKQGIVDYIGGIINRDSCLKTFLVIHYSILERIFGREVRKYQAIEEFLLTYSSQYNVVVTSGRGTPENLPEGVRYVSLSSLFNAVIQVRSKYVISDLLYAARKPFDR